MKRPKRLDYPNGVYGDISYNKQLNKYCSYLENRLKEEQKQLLIDMMQEDEKLGLYEYIGECKGNDNGCFMDSCGHNCGCFKRVRREENSNKKYSEEEVKKILTECTWILKEDKLKWFEKFKK